MKIALIGYGNMGQELSALIAEEKKHEVVSVSFREQTDKLDLSGIKKADVAIDFTSPEILLDNIRQVSKLGVHMVVGTTGWYKNLSKVKQIVQKNKGGLIYAQNFSIGANIFFAAVGFTSRLVSRFGQYDVYGYEIHHAKKKDSPSGTAKKISSVILENFPQKKEVQENKIDRQIMPRELHFASIRGGRNPGYHEVAFDSTADEIKLIHAAHGRRGFAEGAIMAAEFIKNKKGMYNFTELFEKMSAKGEISPGGGK